VLNESQDTGLWERWRAEIEACHLAIRRQPQPSGPLTLHPLDLRPSHDWLWRNLLADTVALKHMHAFYPVVLRVRQLSPVYDGLRAGVIIFIIPDPDLFWGHSEAFIVVLNGQDVSLCVVLP
jgi:hypothetical protein